MSEKQPSQEPEFVDISVLPEKGLNEWESVFEAQVAYDLANVALKLRGIELRAVSEHDPEGIGPIDGEPMS